MKRGPYKKSQKDQETKFKMLDEIIRGCRDIPISLLIKRLKISRATYYRTYHLEALELRKNYSKIALF